MTDFEKLGLFYLGRRHDLATATTLAEPVLYDSRDLLTHAVCLGMTGSGKTGLCVGLIEEAAIDGVPVIAIDPKGDLGNLLLTFPDLSPEAFRPWINADDARRAGLEPEAYAVRQAEAWAAGLRQWGQDGVRIDRLRRAAEFSIFTPGSRAGIPVSILSSLAAPSSEARKDPEALADRAAGTATSLLVLAGADPSPRSREHSLLSGILASSWQAGTALDLGAVIRLVQKPPFDRLGVIDLESAFPESARFELAMTLNTILAAPDFQVWLEGEPLDPAALLHTSDGRPRVSVISIAHLTDAERMFVVSLLLHQIVAWVRRQPGTASLRAVLYMDEIAGYFPPVANPPSKPPLLTLLKQARAHGLGVVLATQNPVDLDYKGLANAGTWFLGRLQTEGDKARVLEGLEGAAAGLERAEADRILSSLGKRIFLMHNVHDAAPTVFETRWTLSYLRGPLTRGQIQAIAAAGAEATRSVPPPAAAAGPAPPSPGAGERPIIPPGIEEFFLPAGDVAPAELVYRPAVLGAARVSFSDRSLDAQETREVLYLAGSVDDAVGVDWEAARKLELGLSDLDRQPVPGARFAEPPGPTTQPKKYAAWGKALGRWLARSERLPLLRHALAGLVSKPGETERDFRIRLQHALRAARDEAIDGVRRKYASKQAAVAERLRRAEAAVAREQQQASDSKVQTALSMGATLLGALLGRRAVSASTLGRATTAARGVGRSMREAADVKRAQESVEAVQAALEKLEAQIEADVAAVAAGFDLQAPLEQVSVAPKRGQVDVLFVALAWVPERAAPAGRPGAGVHSR